MSINDQTPAPSEPGQGGELPAPGTESAAPATPAAPVGGSAPAQRPQPAYGEYAPEGWSWTPPEQEPSSATAPQVSNSASAAVAPAPARPGTGRVPGVPHNLGAPGAANPGLPQATPAAPPAAPAPPSSEQQHYRAAAAPLPQPVSAEKSRLGDRIMTIVLLVLGALGALYSALALYSLPSSISLMGNALEIDNFTVPAAIGTVGTIGALLVFAIYALNLIYSLQRLRARKLAFWVPLVAAVLAGIATFGFNAYAIAQVPELVQQLSDPDAVSRLLEYFSAQ